MRSTLVYIPYEIAGLPVFGLGWGLIAWVLFSVVLLAWLIRTQGWNQETASYLPFLGLFALIILFLLPNMVEYAAPLTQGGAPIPLGIPVRGFGVMMMIAMLASVGLGMYRAWQMGIDPDVMLSLAMCMIFAGLVGARLFFILQYNDDFLRPTLRETLVALIDVTKGGLVVYGSVLAGLPAGIYFLIRRGLPVLAIGDIIAPSMVVGLAVGRIGCFLNGCCYGGECDWPIAVTFPPKSPAFEKQHETGLLYGFKLGFVTREWLPPVRVKEVLPGTAAEVAGLKAGDIIQRINGKDVTSLTGANAALGTSGATVELLTADGQVHTITRPNWPGRSLPIHPTQLYSAIDAALLALVLWLYYPYRRRDGEVFAILVTVHPVSRFVLEAIRTDEAGQFGTPLTISQWLSMGIFIAAGGLWYYLSRQPTGSELPKMTKSE